MPKKTQRNNHVVFLDFDNTITSYDVFDNMLGRFAKSRGWVELEKKWEAGKIGSRECLAGQMDCIRVGRRILNSYLDKVKVDPYSKRLLGLLRAKKIKTFILSDNFDYVLRRVLSSKGIPVPAIYSNRLKIRQDRLIPAFPFTNNRCGACAHCKTKNLLAKAGKDATIVYVGDGRSDTCPSEYADIIFAKEHLKEHCRKKRLGHIPFDGLKDVYDYFKEIYN